MTIKGVWISLPLLVLPKIVEFSLDDIAEFASDYHVPQLLMLEKTKLLIERDDVAV